MILLLDTRSREKIFAPFENAKGGGDYSGAILQLHR
jgi:hypothetical protein